MLRIDLDELFVDDGVPESRSGIPSLLPSTAIVGGNATCLVDKAYPPTGAPQLVPDTRGLQY